MTGLKTLDLGGCEALTALPESLGFMTGLKTMSLGQCEALTALPESLELMTGLKTIDLPECKVLTALPANLGALTALETLDLRGCKTLTALPVSLGTLANLTLDLRGCDSLHTPPPSIVRAGKVAVLQFLRDLAKGEAPSHLIKVVLLGDQRAGKSSLADSLVLGRPATRADNDRTVGIEVRRWRVRDQSSLVANIYDVAGQRVYRATHGFFMSPGALFLHVVRCNMAEELAVAALLEWVEAVQQEAPGAVMGIVWTHVDHFCGSLHASADWQEGLLYVADVTQGYAVFEMYYLHHHGVPCSLKNVVVARFHAEPKDMAKVMDDAASGIGTNVISGVGTGDFQGKVALIDLRNKWDRHVISLHITTALSILVRAGAVGLMVIINDYYFQSNHFQRILSLDEIKPLFSDVASIPIIFIRKMHAEPLAPTGVIITAFRGANLCVVIRTCLPMSRSIADLGRTEACTLLLLH